MRIGLAALIVFGLAATAFNGGGGFSGCGPECARLLIVGIVLAVFVVGWALCKERIRRACRTTESVGDVVKAVIFWLCAAGVLWMIAEKIA